MLAAADILHFWFTECGEKDWFGGGKEFDARLAARFADTHAAVARGEAFGWRTTVEGRVAEIVVLDQFSRQIHRGSPKAFASDDMALTLAQELVAQGLDQSLDPSHRMFAYMPYMHSESLVIHAEAVRLFEALGRPDTLDYELAHKKLIERFGRYPKRNAVLGRTSSPEELAYIAENSEGDF